MSTLSKHTIEATHPESDSGAAGAGAGIQSPPAAGHLHSDAVSLEVPIKIHGSKVTGAAGGGTPHPEPFEEQTTSMIVFPHGGVLRMSTPVNIGQMLVLTNLKSRQDAICRVVKVRSYSASSSYVEVEFTHRQPGYWGVLFASDDSAPTKAATLLSPAETAGSNGGNPITATAESSGEGASPKTVVMPMGVSPAYPAPASKPGSAFAPIGSQEDVQPPAASTTRGPIAPSAKIGKPALVPSVQKLATADVLAPSPATTPANKESKAVSSIGTPAVSDASEAQVQEEDISITGETISEAPRTSATSFNAPQSTRSSGQLFGVPLQSKESAGQNSAAGKNWILIAACAAGLFVAAGSGYLLLHHRSGEPAGNAPHPVATQPSVTQPMPAQPPATPVATVQSAPVRVDASAQPNLKRGPQPVGSARENPTVSSRQTDDTADSVPQREQPAQSTQTASSASSTSTMPSMFGALNAHPVSTRRSEQAPTAAPALEAGTVSPGEGNVLPGIAPAGAALAPPAMRPTGPVPVGGPIKEPKVVTRVLPTYPPFARQARTEGDVVLDIVVDKTGGVSAMRVVSGPPTLRQAAVDAVRRWKYQLTILDGEPISVQMQVTIQFRL